MANETVVRIGADSSGYTTGIEKARRSAKAFIADQSELARRTRVAQGAMAEAAENGSNASARAVKSFTDALLKNAATAGKTRAEILQMRAANLGLADSVKPYIEQIAKASAHTHGFSLASAGAKRELLVLGHELSQGNVKQFAGSMLVMAERTGAFASLLNPAVLAAGAFAGVLAMAAHATFAAREALASYGETVETVSRQTGISTDGVQRFGFAAKTAGVETRDAAAALGELGKAQNGAQHGNRDAAAAFNAVGISLSDVRKSSPEQLLGRIADAFSKSAAGAGKAAVANELFGTSGKDLIPLLDQGSAHLDALAETAGRVGAVLSANTIAQLAALQEQLALSHAKMDAMTLSARTRLLPAIISLTDALADNVALQPLMNDFYTGIGVIVKAAASAVSLLVVGFQQVSEAMATTAVVAGYAMTRQFRLASAAAQAGYANFRAQGQGYADFMAKLWGNAVPAAPHAGVAVGHINFLKGAAGGGKDHHPGRSASLLEQAKQAQAVLEQSLSGQEKLTGWAAREVELRAEIDGYAGKTLTRTQQSVLASKEALLTQYAQNASLEQQLEQRGRSEKMNSDAYETNAKILAQSDALAERHRIELSTLGLGTQERERQIELLRIETDRQKELLGWQKKAVELKLDGSGADGDERAAINRRFDARRDEQRSFNASRDLARGDWMSGAKSGLQDIIDKTNDLSAAASGAAQNAINGLGDAIASFATTGKMSFGAFAKSVIASLIKVQAQALIARAALSMFGYASGGSVSMFAPAVTAATGGLITGPGSGTSDSIPARLSNGEFVMNAAAVRRLGASNLMAMNSGEVVHSMARYATGGLVGAASPGASAASVPSISVPISVSVASSTGSTSSPGRDSPDGTPFVGRHLAEALRQAVLKELVIQKRPNGLLWRA
ncbi:phage tail tape measure protein [Paraburkholderia bonniea]|uniref:phage tail tape measure protein n=1 Tax=Paraburkholderia bonniea TaxID=2152891 RepID=UPI001291CE34|nr:phage tail tape measure protein [Paraburkholderia bonniea]